VAAGGQEFIMFGVPVVALGGLPTDRPLPVEGVPRDYGTPVGSRWETIRVVTGIGRVAQTRQVGHVGVDWARVMVADADALGCWQHEEPLDGLADVVIWGLHAAEAAAAHDAPPLSIAGENDMYGWQDLDIEEAADRAAAIEEWRTVDPTRRLGLDFRPHSHHWQVMREVHASPEETGTVDVGGARLLCAMTSWGDGIFGVHADYDETGTLLAVRIVLGDDARAARLAALYRR
jgi:hypothetical protein